MVRKRFRLSSRNSFYLINRSYQQDGNMNEVRCWRVKRMAPGPLDHARGSRFDYSNLGYVIAVKMGSDEQFRISCW
jgi:hypothetical protein